VAIGMFAGVTALLAILTSSAAGQALSTSTSSPTRSAAQEDQSDDSEWWRDLVAPAAGLLGATVGAGTVLLSTGRSLDVQERNRALAAYHEQLAGRIHDALLSVSKTFAIQAELDQVMRGSAEPAQVTATASQLRAQIADTKIRSALIDNDEIRQLCGLFVTSSNAVLNARANVERLAALNDSADHISSIEGAAGRQYREAVRFHTGREA
jgi:hypothetical protein